MKVISVCDELRRAEQLMRSLNHFGWENEIIRADWRGFGTKVNETANYLKNNKHVKEFFFLDAYDTFALGRPEEFTLNVESLISAEINCWPDAEKAHLYPQTGYKFKYANSGSYYMKSELFLDLWHSKAIHNGDDDQRWMTDNVLERHLNIDYEREVFQTLCGVLPNDFEIIDVRIVTDNNTRPLFVHGNGKAKMDEYYALI